MATSKQCCEYAELIEYTAIDGVTVIAYECPSCGGFSLSAAWGRLDERVKNELSARRLIPLSA